MPAGHEKTLISILTFSLSLSHTAVAEVKFPWKDPGTAKIECDTASATLSNRMFSASFRKAGKGVVFDGMKMSNGKGVAQSGTFTTPDTDGAIDVDASIDITLKPQEVIVLEGICAAGANAESDNDDDDGADAQKSKKKKKGSRKSGKKKKKARK